WLDVDDTLAVELRERLGRLGFDGELDAAFNAWAGNENLEERVDGVERVDPVVLEELRRQS
ncbi:MAG TPA: putative peptidoglycan binding domain-containing protein, partial [Gaiellaceae bacterium]|nr:putative peptidoglycan binding domain-containing protein [Gaiellaceae bacterium]